MRIGDLLTTAFASLWQRKFRTCLTVLGVLIGTTAVVVMVAVGLGMAKAQFDSIEKHANLRQIVIMSPPVDTSGRTQKRMDDTMLNDLKMLAPNAMVYPVYSVPALATVDGYESYINIRGVSADALAKQQTDIASGTTITPGGSQLQLVTGHMVKEHFWGPAGMYTPDGGTLAGQTLKLNFDTEAFGEMMPGGKTDGNDSSTKTPLKKINASVVGQLAGEAGQYSSTSDLVLADLDALVKALKKVYPGKALPNQDATSEGKPKGTFLYSEFVIETETIEEAKELFQLLKDLQYEALAAVEWMDQMEEQTQLTLAVFGGIGAISLLVAAIGIANTMMMSVYERTREIGVMKVLGAALGDIRSLFLLEAAGIGFIGGVLGVLVSYPLGSAVSQWVSQSLGSGGMGMDPATPLVQTPLWLALSAIGFATLIGTLAGLLPAHRAMKLSALDAIRTQ